MPLTKPDDSHLDGIHCACKGQFADHASYYAHVGDCPIIDLDSGHMCMVGRPEALAGPLNPLAA